MKTIYLLCVLFVFFTACDWLDLEKKSEDSSTLGGSSDIPVNTVGNTFSSSVKMGSTPFASNASITVSKVENEVATVHINSKLPTSNSISQLIPSGLKDASGNLNCDLKVKFTDEGILDYTNKDHKPLVLVKYDANVGDEYVLEKSDGKTITRKVTSKSTTDDYAWSGMLIKTIKVEQDSRIPGVKKIEYIANHRFGLVGIKLYLEDGTTSQIDLASAKF